MSDHARELFSFIAKNWLWILIVGVLLTLFGLVAPGPIYFWSVRGFKSLFHDDLAFGDAWSSFLAFACAFFYALLAPFAVRWLIVGARRFDARLKAFLSIMIVFGSAPVLHALLDSNFNQASGQAQKWYVWQPNGEVVLSDSGGFDPNYGVEKRPLTPEVARIIERQKRGLGPKPVLGDPRQLTFFDPASGRPRIWYYKAVDGRYALYDLEGFNPQNGELLVPVTSDVARAIKTHADADDVRMHAEEKAAKERAEAEARTSMERSEAQAREKARKQLVELFGPDTYPRGAVIVGARARHPSNNAAVRAAKRVISDIVAKLRSKGVDAAELLPTVYTSAYFDALMRGDATVLAEVGLEGKMRMMVLALVDADCRQVTDISGVVSCTVAADLRTFKSDSGNAAQNEWTETGAGSDLDDAIGRAVDLLIERHPGLLKGA